MFRLLPELGHVMTSRVVLRVFVEKDRGLGRVKIITVRPRPDAYGDLLAISRMTGEALSVTSRMPTRSSARYWPLYSEPVPFPSAPIEPRRSFLQDKARVASYKKPNITHLAR